MRLDHAGRAALRRNRMAAHRQDFRDQRDGERGVRLGGRDRGPQAGAARANDHDIGLKEIDDAPLFTISIKKTDCSNKKREQFPSLHALPCMPKTTPDLLKYIIFQNDVCATHRAQVDRTMISVPTRH